MPGSRNKGRVQSPGLRVLFLAARLGPGGVVTHMKNLATGLQARGWGVAVASQGRYGCHSHGPDWFEEEGIRHFQVDFPEPRLDWGNLAAGCRALPQLIRAVRVFRPTLVHSHWRTTGIYASWLSGIHRIPFVSTLHIDGIAAAGLRRVASRWGRRCIAISQETYRSLTSTFRVPAKQVSMVHYGVDDHHFRPPSQEERVEARRHFQLSPRQQVACLIGSDWRRKGHDVAVQALAELKGAAGNLVVLLAGEPAGLAPVLDLACELGVQAMIRPVGYADTRQVLWASDLLLFPSRREGLPIVVIEAMLSGVVPVRTPTSGAFDQTLDGINGFVVPFDDPPALAARLRRLLSDPDLRRKMAETAISMAREKFRADRMVEKTIQVYRAALAAQSPRRWATPAHRQEVIQ